MVLQSLFPTRMCQGCGSVRYLRTSVQCSNAAALLEERPMTRTRCIIAGLFCLLPGLGLVTVAQEPKQRSESKAGQAAEADAMPAAPTTDMNEMASAMKSMADMCRMMMEREMQSRPYLMVAGAAVGALAFVALVLFIVLEVQWIRLLAVRIKAERQKLSQ
jgi:hypothetical protein